MTSFGSAVPRGAMTVKEAEEILGLSKAMVHKLVKAGRIRVAVRESFPGGSRLWLVGRDVRKLARERKAS